MSLRDLCDFRPLGIEASEADKYSRSIAKVDRCVAGAGNRSQGPASGLRSVVADHDAPYGLGDSAGPDRRDATLEGLLQQLGLGSYLNLLQKKLVGREALLEMDAGALRALGLPLAARRKLLEFTSSAAKKASAKATITQLQALTPIRDRAAAPADAAAASLPTGEGRPAGEQGGAGTILKALSSPRRVARQVPAELAPLAPPAAAATELLLDRSLAEVDRSATRPPPADWAAGGSSHREASRLVADWDVDAPAAVEPLAAGPPLTASLPDWTTRNASYAGMTANYGPEIKSLKLYPYGIDEVITHKVSEYADPYGDGLMLIDNANIWVDRKFDEVMRAAEVSGPSAGAGGTVQFKRTAFSWRKKQHILMGLPVSTPSGGFFMEVVFTAVRMEKFQKKRETEHNLIVVPEFELCWQIAELAAVTQPDPPKTFARGGRTVGWHVNLSYVVPERKFYLLPEPKDPQETEITILRAAAVQKVPDDGDHFEKLLGQMRAGRVVEEMDAGWTNVASLGNVTSVAVLGMDESLKAAVKV